jgi:hypothetical protein
MARVVRGGSDFREIIPPPIAARAMKALFREEAKRTQGLREASAEIPAFTFSDNPVVSQFESLQWLEKRLLGQTA